MTSTTSTHPRQTIRQLLTDTTARFNRAQVDSPASTARVLLSQVLGRPREWLMAHDDVAPDAQAVAGLEQLIVRVIAREPLAYILGHREFFGIDLLVDARVLIPRPETEMLVELALAHLRRHPSQPPLAKGGSKEAGTALDERGIVPPLGRGGSKEADTAPPLDQRDIVPPLSKGGEGGVGATAMPAQPGQGPEPLEEVDVIDVGTGSGAVAIAIGAHAPGARVVATDISHDALAVAAANAQRCGVSERIRLMQSDLLEALALRAWVITANLPYVTVEEIEVLPPEIQSHEPRVALDGGADGLALVRRLLAQLDTHLLPGGMAVFEIGASQGPAALQAARSALPGWQVELKQDLAKLDRVLYVRKL